MTFQPDSKLVSAVHVAANCEPRRLPGAPSLVILHYTGMSSAEKAIDWLAREESQVSCHYVIDTHGRITQLVPEAMRAWHAGKSYWRGECDINSCSIGIEIQNPGHEHGYPNFPPAQMRAVVALVGDIVARHGMDDNAVLAHSDVAPGRKIDPGEKFNWALMARAGLGLYVRPHPVSCNDDGLGPGDSGARIAVAQAQLSALGYDAPVTGVMDVHTVKVLRSFQLHFRRKKTDGRLDRSTERTLTRVLEAAGVAVV